MSNKNIIVLLVFTLLISLTAPIAGMPAYPHPIKVTQSDGTSITIQLHGDEYFNYATTLDGHTVIQKTDGLYYYATLNSEGLLTASNTRVTSSGSGIKSRSSSPTSKHVFSQAAYNKGQTRREEAAIRRAERLEKSTNKIAASAQTKPAKAIVLLVEFQDVEFTVAQNPQVDFHNLMNQEGYSVGKSIGSVRDYFLFNSMDQFDISFDVRGPYKVSEEVAHYGRNGFLGDMNPQDMVTEACKLAHADGVDFSQYAINGEVPNLIIIYAGYGEADSGKKETIWQHEGTLGVKSINLNGVKINTYACSQEIFYDTHTLTGIGVICHEFSHVLGIPDFYDLNGAIEGSALGLWVTSVMDTGGYLADGCVPPAYNAVERWLAGWLTIEEIKSGGAYTLNPIEENKAYRINTTTSNEFFVFEFRNGISNKWDQIFSAGEPKYNIKGNASGLMIYHVDRSTNNLGGTMARDTWKNNSVNSNASHECMRMVTSVVNNGEASFKRNMNNFVFPGAKNQVDFTPETAPAFLSWIDTNTGFAVKDIQVNGNENISFSVINLNQELEGYVTPVLSTQQSIVLGIHESLTGKWNVEFQKKDKTEISRNIESESNIFSITGLQPNTPYEITISKSTNPSNKTVLNVTTLDRDRDRDTVPNVRFLPIPETKLTLIDTFNLQNDVQSVKWFVNGTETDEVIHAFTSTSQVKCVVYNTDGSKEVFITYFTVE